mgnify:CR=1 FL=1
MSYIYLQEQGEVSSVDNFSDIPQCVLLKLNSTQDKSCCNDNETECCPSSPSGTMSAPLMGSPGEKQLMSFAEDSPAKICQSPTPTGKDLKDRGRDCGLKCGELLMRYSPKLSLWRTAEDLFPEELDESSVIFPKSGIWEGTRFWAAMKPDLARTVRGSGFTLQRPTASDGKRFKQFKLSSLVRPHHPNGNLAEQLAQRGMRRLTPECAEILMRWPQGWSDSKPLETAKIQYWQQQHGIFFHNK